jgi:hypothetical protein
MTASSNYKSNNLPCMQNQRLPGYFRLLMMVGVSPETCWASYKYEINFDTLLNLVEFFIWIIFSYFNVTWVPVLFLRQCGTSHFRNYSPALLEKHKDSLSQFICCDKNCPSVIFWSIANEARTHLSDADSYFR